MAVTGDISKEINTRDLLSLGELEQTMLTKDSQTDSYNEILEKMDDPRVKLFDLVRVVLLFCIKYEGSSKAGDL